MNESISVSLFLFLLFSLRSLTLRRGIHHLIVLHDSRIGEQLQALLRQRITMTLLEHTAATAEAGDFPCNPAKPYDGN